MERPSRPARSLLLAAALVALLGCNQSPFLAARQNAWRREQQQYLAQTGELQRRAIDLDANNQDLHADLAQTQREVQLHQQQIDALRKRLAETSQQLADERSARQEAQTQLSQFESSLRQRGGAIITANNSIKRRLGGLEIEGLETRIDGDVVRIEVPAEKLFLPASATLHQGAFSLLDQVADAIHTSYPRQIVGIEGHTDSGPPEGGQFSSNHHLSADQARAVFDQFTSRGGLNPQQLFVLGHGGNHPIVSNGTLAGKMRNRRIELVVYPETTEGG